MKRIGIILAGWLWLTASLAQAAHTQVRLLLSADTARPGDTVMAAVMLNMEEGWHTYWKNPGAAGQATDLKWQLPAGVTAGEIQWPLPEKLPPAEVATYAYRDEVMLLVPLKLAGPLPPRPARNIGQGFLAGVQGHVPARLANRAGFADRRQLHATVSRRVANRCVATSPPAVQRGLFSGASRVVEARRRRSAHGGVRTGLAEAGNQWPPAS